MQKRLTDEQLLGAEGIALIDRAVSRIGFAWRPTAQHDVGIDGEIEIRDPASGIMTGQIIKVQSKAVTNFRNETEDGFDFWCEERDVRYWLSHNVPVILMVSRPSSDELYWRSVRRSAEDPSAIGRFRFVKSRDRLNVQARTRLAELVRHGHSDGTALAAGELSPQSEAAPLSAELESGSCERGEDRAAMTRYAANRHRAATWGWNAYLAFIAAFGGFAAALLPLILKSGFLSQEVDFAATRIASLFGSGAISKENIYTVSFMLSVPNAAILWLSGHLLADPIATGIHCAWRTVNAALRRRIAGMSMLLCAFVLAGHYFWLLFPKASYWQALGLPLLAFAGAVVRARSE